MQFMEINLPPAEQESISRHAQAAGYDDVTLFVTDHVRALATELAAYDPNAEQLEESVERLQRADASIDAGGGVEAEKVFRETADRYGLKRPE